MENQSDEERFMHEVQSEQEWVHDMLNTPWAAEIDKDGAMKIIDKDGVPVFKIDSRSPEYAALAAAVIVEHVNSA